MYINIYNIKFQNNKVMRVIKTKHFPFNGYKAINLFGIIFTKGELSNKELNHEAIHTEQMKEMLYIFFYIWYGVEYLIIRLFHIKQHDAYKDVSFEEEAHINDDNLNYISKRKHYTWTKYLGINSSKTAKLNSKDMEDDKRVNYKLDAINKLINNLKLSISGNKEHDELGENNVIVNLDEISQKITELHEMVKAEFDEFENQHKSESDETQTLLNNRFDKIDAKLDSIKAAVDSMKTTIGNKLDTVNSTINKANTDIVAAINAMKASNDTKNDAIITALQGLVTKVNENTNNINSLNGRVDALEQA